MLVSPLPSQPMMHVWSSSVCKPRINTDMALHCTWHAQSSHHTLNSVHFNSTANTHACHFVHGRSLNACLSGCVSHLNCTHLLSICTRLAARHPSLRLTVSTSPCTGCACVVINVVIIHNAHHPNLLSSIACQAITPECLVSGDKSMHCPFCAARARQPITARPPTTIAAPATWHLRRLPRTAPHAAASGGGGCPTC